MSETGPCLDNSVCIKEGVIVVGSHRMLLYRGNAVMSFLGFEGGVYTHRGSHTFIYFLLDMISFAPRTEVCIDLCPLKGHCLGRSESH